MSNAHRPIAWLLFTALVTAAPVFAQEATTDQPESEAEETESKPVPQMQAGTEEMVITARKREESIQEAPLAVTGFDEETLDALGVNQTDDVSLLAPNVYISQTPASAANIGLSIRGIGGAEPLLTRDTGVAMYVDGAYIARTAGAVFDLMDLQRVEVLRGPQGTLYGRNATGGAINYISRRPKETPGVELTAGYGSFDEWLTRATVDTGEIAGSDLSSTFTFFRKRRDGIVNDHNASDRTDPGASNTEAFRTAFAWNPVEAFTASYSLDHSNLVGQAPYFQLVAVAPEVSAALATPPVIDDDRSSRGNRDTEDFLFADDTRSKHRITGHNLTLDYDFEITRLKLITTYREWDNSEEGGELDGNADLIANTFFGPQEVQLLAGTIDRHQHQFSEEVQFSGPVGERVDYVTGVYFFRERFDEYNPQAFLVTSLANPFLPPGVGFYSNPDPSTGAGILDYDGKAESWALFTDWSWTPPVLEDRLKLSVGARYSDDTKSFSQRANPPTLTVNRGNEADWSHFDWQGTASMEWTDAFMNYLRVGTAYKAGGFNPRSGMQAAPKQNSLEPFDEEVVTTYELGAKSELFEDRIVLNGAIFYSDYDDLQVDQFVAGAGGASSITLNAGKAHIWGIEVETLAQLTDHIAGYLNYGWLDMDYDEFEIRDPGTDLIVDVADQARFGFRPDQTLAAGFVFESDPLGDWGAVLGSRIDAVYADDIYSHAIARAPSGAPINPFAKQVDENGYAVFNASLSLSEIPIGSESRLRFTLWGKNLLDEEYRRSGVDFGALGFAGVVWGEPRTYGLTMSFEY